MRLKSYFATDVKAALNQARRELGPEALLVNSRPAPPEARHLGECEVVVALGVPEPVRHAAPSPSARAGDETKDRMASLERKLERAAVAIARASLVAAGRSAPRGELAGIFAGLIASELDPELAEAIIERVREQTGAAASENPERRLESELARLFRVDPTLGTGPSPRVVALVGPTASGKTTTLVKLAARYGLSPRRPAQIISLDSYRIAAAEQLRCYAAILGTGFQALESPAALARALEEHRNKDLVLIDTPGYGLREMDAAGELAAVLSSRDDIDVHLVLTASMKPADLTRVAECYERFRPSKLIFTRLDETATFGPMVSEAARSARPISFLASGQQIPEDLEPAATARVLELVLGREQIQAAGAAA